VTVGFDEAARFCAAILTQVGLDTGAVVVRDAETVGGGGKNSAGQSVEVRIRSAEVDGCRADVAAALVGAHAALVGLAGLASRRSRVLAEVDTVDVIATCQGDRLAQLLCPRAAPTLEHRAPQVMPCLDGYVGIHVPTEDDRELLTALTEGEELASWVGRRRREEIVEAAQLWRLPVVAVLSPAEVKAGEPFRFTWTGAPRRAMSLRDLRVLDLGMLWAGPYCGRLLAGLGARVIKVEGPQRADSTRRADSHACQGAFADLNRGKTSLVVDLSRPEGRDVLLRLVRSADVLIENFSPRVMPNFGLDFDVLSEVNPQLVMLSMPAFADNGGVAYGSGLEMAAGLLGWGLDGQPLPSQVAYLDYLAGCYGAIGVLGALLRGGGAHVRVAQRDVAAEVVALSGGRRRQQAGMAVDLVRFAEAARCSGLLAADGAAHGHYTRLPFHVSGMPSRREADAPGFGAHSRQVLHRHARLTSGEIETLVGSGVVQ
jgi:crotonobetainyl-CoA:carnitine CoA-transferase CaiB-like acyl-CoA transferase